MNFQIRFSDFCASPLVSAVLLIIVSIIIGTIVFPVDVELMIFGIVFGLFAIGKTHYSFWTLVRRSTKKNTDIFGLPRWFVGMSTVILLLAAVMAYIAFGGLMSPETHPQTEANLRFLTLTILIAVCVIHVQWIFIRKDLRAYLHKIKSKHLSDEDSHLFSN